MSFLLENNSFNRQHLSFGNFSNFHNLMIVYIMDIWRWHLINCITFSCKKYPLLSSVCISHMKGSQTLLVCILFYYTILWRFPCTFSYCIYILLNYVFVRLCFRQLVEYTSPMDESDLLTQFRRAQAQWIIKLVLLFCYWPSFRSLVLGDIIASSNVADV